MMFNKVSTSDRTSRFWRFDDSDEKNDGPVALLRELSALIWTHKIKLIVCVSAGFALLGAYAHSLPRTYVSTATLLLEPRQAAIPGQDGGPALTLDLNRADSELQIISSERLLATVFESLGLQSNPELGAPPPSPLSAAVSFLKKASGIGEVQQAQTADISSAQETAQQVAFSNFRKHLSVRRVGQSFVIEIQYSSVDPTVPARVANAAVSGYIMQAVSFKAETVRTRSESLQGRLDALGAQVESAAEAMRRGQLPAIPTPDADARIIGAALAPLAPAGPRVTLIALLGGVLGLLAGSGLVVLSLARDRKIVSADDLAREAALPCLGIVPIVQREKEAFGLRLRHAASIRDLRTSIDIACSPLRAERGIVLALVGWNNGSAVSDLSMSLAQLITGGSGHVTLFQAVNRHEGADSYQRQSASHSLVDAALSDLQAGIFSFRNIDGVAVLPIHSTNATSNLYADFRHPRISRLLSAMQDRGDVILDLPPIEGSKDALALATHADAVVFAASIGQTTVRQVVSAMQQLRRTRAKLIGTVILSANP